MNVIGLLLYPFYVQYPRFLGPSFIRGNDARWSTLVIPTVLSHPFRRHKGSGAYNTVWYDFRSDVRASTREAVYKDDFSQSGPQIWASSPFSAQTDVISTKSNITCQSNGWRSGVKFFAAPNRRRAFKPLFTSLCLHVFSFSSALYVPPGLKTCSVLYGTDCQGSIRPFLPVVSLEASSEKREDQLFDSVA